MKKYISILIIMLMLLSMSVTAFASEINYSKVEYLSDLTVMKKLLEQNHGNLYESVSKEDLDKAFKEAESNISDDTTIQDFYFEISKVVSSINDGHTYLLPSKNFLEKVKNEKTYLPLRVKFIDGKMYSDLSNEYVPVGAEILEINDEKVSDVVSKLNHVMGNESNNDLGLPNSFLEIQLPYMYPQFIKAQKDHKIMFKDPKDQKVKTVVMKSEDISLDKLLNFAHSNYIKNMYANSAAPLKADFDEEKSTAVLRIYSFMTGNPQLFKEYVDKFFEDVKYRGIENIIFDVRGNLGGQTSLGAYILSYIYDEDFYFQKSMVLKNPDLSRPDLLTESGKKEYETLKKAISMSKKGKDYVVNKDGSYDFKEEIVKPMKKNNFDGNVYALVDGGSFSCGSMFPEKVQQLPKGSLIGTETSGNYYQITAGMIPKWELPNTKIRISIPLMQMMLEDKENKDIKRNSGVKPDYEVKLNLDDFIKGKDTQLQFAYDLIQK